MAVGGSSSGGSAAIPGAGRSGEGGAPPFWTCFDGGRGYLPGASFPSSDGCNTCKCHPDGTVACTAMACEPDDYCIYAGVVYASGESFETECNTCTCNSGSIECTPGPCPIRPCAEISADYAAALAQAKRCDPKLSKVQCAVRVPSSLQCGCPTAFNYETPALNRLALEWQRNECSTNVLCGACPSQLGAGYCDLSGACADQLQQ